MLDGTTSKLWAAGSSPVVSCFGMGRSSVGRAIVPNGSRRFLVVVRLARMQMLVGFTSTVNREVVGSSPAAHLGVYSSIGGALKNKLYASLLRPSFDL